MQSAQKKAPSARQRIGAKQSATINYAAEPAKASATRQSCNGPVLDAMIKGHEETVIAAMMDEFNQPVELAVDKDDFADPRRLIVAAITDIRNAGDSAPHLKKVTERLRAQGELEKVGGAAEITRIANETHSPAILADAVKRVQEAANARRAVEIGKQLVSGGITPELALKNLTALSTPQRGWLEHIDAAIVTSSELASLELNPRRPLLSEWLCEGDYGIIFAPRGVGKTWLAQVIAKAISTGGRVGAWLAPSPAKVLYIDGEMPPDLMRDRDRGLGEGEVEILNHAILFDRTGQVLNITDPAQQRAILERCIRDGIKLVVLDNLSTLASGVKENDSYEWELLQTWLLNFRRHGIAVILVHHAGRNGEPRGTSKREDAAFWVIALDDARKHSDDKRGARFISRFTKPSRNTQEEIPPYEWHIVTDQDTGQVTVGCTIARSMDVFRRYIADGITDCSQLADEMKVSRGTISKWAKRAELEGWLKKKGRDYELVGVGNDDGNEDPEK
jgi:hypothetical protein